MCRAELRRFASCDQIFENLRTRELGGPAAVARGGNGEGMGRGFGKGDSCFTGFFACRCVLAHVGLVTDS